jgi:hypothetical protein
MKHQQLFKGLLAMMILTFSFTLTGMTAQGQSSSTLLTADVPFQFSLGKKTLPAGKYQIRKMSIGISKVLRLTNAQGKHVALIAMREINSIYKFQSESCWIFNRYGDQYSLSQVWMAGESGVEIDQTQVEQQVAKSLKAARPTEVSVKLNRQ